MSRLLVADFSTPKGNIRPLHGVNSGPMNKVFTYDSRPLFREIGVPYARLHDIEYPYGSGEFVDIPCIFRNFDADENDSANYNFALTDLYLSHIVEVEAEPFFRLGVSIEHAPVKRYIYPPKDFKKWARICEHIIRHYTEGWADGYHWQISYWEIWNEADGHGNMWLGTPEQYYELYAVAARHLKKCFPHLKIGGGGFCRGVNEFTIGFMRYLADAGKQSGERVPLDFYSWHQYFAEINKMTDEATATDAMLAEYGYADAESVFDEWNYMISWDLPMQSESYRHMKNHIGAAHHAAVLCAMQDRTNIALACYFEADVVKEFCGIFETTDMAIGAGKHAKVGPTKAFYGFKYFGELYRLGGAVPVEGCGEHVYAIAATGVGGHGLLAVNYDSAPCDVSCLLHGLDPDAVLTLHLTDAEHTDSRLFDLIVPPDGTVNLALTLPPYAVIWMGV